MTGRPVRWTTPDATVPTTTSPTRLRLREPRTIRSASLASATRAISGARPWSFITIWLWLLMPAFWSVNIASATACSPALALTLWIVRSTTAANSPATLIVSGASPTELARSHPISRSWLFRLLARYKEGGYEALEPRSRRPKSCPSQTAPEIQQAIVDLRRELTDAGLDAGAQTIAHHLRLRFGTAPSRPTIWRILKSNGLIEPQPHKRPKSSWIRLQTQGPRRHPPGCRPPPSGRRRRRLNSARADP